MEKLREHLHELPEPLRSIVKRVADQFDELDRNYHRFARRSMAVLGLLLVTQVGQGIWNGCQESDASNRADEAKGLAQAIQDERFGATLRACRSNSRQNAAIQTFIRGVEPELLDRAAREFPITTERQCQSNARRAVQAEAGE